MTDNEHLKVFLNPLAFVPTMGTSVAGAPSEPTPESVLDFLCTPGVDSDVAALVRRCREISAEPEPLFAAPADDRILDKLVWSLLHAKGSYILGNYLGTITLCGMVSEMLAIQIFEVDEPEVNGARMTETAQGELFDSSFEKLGQERRASILHAYGLIDDALKTSFDRIRTTRRQYLHLWSKDYDKLSVDAVACSRRAEHRSLRSRSDHPRRKAGSRSEAHQVSARSRRVRSVGTGTVAGRFDSPGEFLMRRHRPTMPLQSPHAAQRHRRRKNTASLSTSPTPDGLRVPFAEHLPI